MSGKVKFKALAELAKTVDNDLEFAWKAKKAGLLKYEHTTASQNEIDMLMNRRVYSRKKIYEDDKIVVVKEVGSLGFLYWVHWKKADGTISIGFY